MNIAVPRPAESFPRWTFTVDDIRRMMEAGILTEDDRFELIEGDLVMMAAKGFAHERIKLEVNLALARALPPDLMLGVETTLRFTETLMLEPDLSVFPRSVYGHPKSGFIALDPGEALLVIEVAYSSLSYDKGLKSRFYARHGVREFWVIEANERKTWVHTGARGEEWDSVVELGPEATLTTAAVPGFAIRLADV